MNKFKEFNKKTSMLDVSVKSVDKFITSNKKKDVLLYSDVIVEQKTDGVKITALKINSKGTLDDWIISYKGNILYDGEFDYISTSCSKQHSIGSSQFKIVLEHFSDIAFQSKDIETGMEFFIEFLMNKPTLSSNYKKRHKLILIGYSMSSYYKSYNGILKIKSGDINLSARDSFADILGVDVPEVLFDGILGFQKDFAKGIKNKNLKNFFENKKNSMNWDSHLLIDDLKELFLKVPSKYGGLEEGVVIKIFDENGIANLLKWQQSYQNDKEARYKIKMKYKANDPEEENQYWSNVRSTSLRLIEGLDGKLEDSLVELSNRIKNLYIEFKHPKKILVNIKDDIQLTSKLILIKRLPGNNNALIIGKFRVVTNAHKEIIEYALEKYDGVVISLVSNKDTKKTLELRKRMVLELFGGRISIIESTSGNITTLINKCPDNINAIVSGSDRTSTYRNQLSRHKDITLDVIERTDSDISASKIIENINNFEYFKENTPESIWVFYNELKDTLKGI